MQFLSDAGALCHAFLEAGVDSGGDLADAEAVECRSQGNTAGEQKQAKPGGLEPGGRNPEVERGAGLVPNAIVVTGDGAETILAGTELGVVSLPARARILPSLVDTRELVSKQHALG